MDVLKEGANEDKESSHHRNSTHSGLYGTDAESKAKAKASKRAQRASKPGVATVSSSGATVASAMANATTGTLYGNDADAKAKEKASKGSKRASKPGVETVSSSGATVASNMTTGTLYGSDADAKAKAKASKSSLRATKPGVDTVASSGITVSSNMTSATVATLYGSDADAKAKATGSRGTSKRSSAPGVEYSSHASVASGVSTATTATLYGNDSDAKAKAKGSRGFSSNPGVETISLAASSSSSAADTLYGNASDAKAKARASRGGSAFSANPGVESIALPATMAPVAESIDEKDGEAPVARRVSQGGTDSVSGSNIDPDNQMQGEEADPSKAPSKAPSSSSSGTPMAPVPPPDSGFASFSPTAPPGLVELIFQPPSKSNCDAIANNETIAGRDELDTADFGLNLEIVLADDNVMTRPLVDELLNAIQEKILPSVAGCNIRADEFVEKWRFVILDAFVTGNAKNEETCNNRDLVAENCHRVNVQLDIFLKGFVRFLDIIRLISAEEVNIANNLDLSDTFSIIQLVAIDNLTPTTSPTIMPSDTPTPSPTPSVRATKPPTKPPTAAPSKAPTTRPATKSPTKSPTKRPTKAPTKRPTSPPTMQPITSSPSKSPSKGPVVEPSELPSAEPVASFNLIAEDRKCPLFSNRVGKVEGVSGVEECFEECISNASCRVFSVGTSWSTSGRIDCHLCQNDNGLWPENGIDAYEVTAA
ncbi:MAG: hypothetical protein SGBAC_007224 [Bacillariaceae sp.]